MPDGEEGHSNWGRTPAELSLSGLQLGIDMVVRACLRRAGILTDWSAVEPTDQGPSNLSGGQKMLNEDINRRRPGMITEEMVSEWHRRTGLSDLCGYESEWWLM